MSRDRIITIYPGRPLTRVGGIRFESVTNVVIDGDNNVVVITQKFPKGNVTNHIFREALSWIKEEVFDGQEQEEPKSENPDSGADETGTSVHP